MKEGKGRKAKRAQPAWELRLYIADTTPRSVLARENVERLCERYLTGRCRVTIIDLAKQPTLARRDEILAVPTLVRVTPGPQKAVIGTLADTERVLAALEMSETENLGSLFTGAGIQLGNA